MNQKVKISDIIEALKVKYDLDNILPFNDHNVQEQIEKNPYRIQYFNERLILAEFSYEESKNDYDKKIAIKYHNLRFDSEHDLSKVEIEKYYFNKDDEIIALKRILYIKKIKIKWFESVIEAFKNRQWSLKTFSDNARSNAI